MSETVRVPVRAVGAYGKVVEMGSFVELELPTREEILDELNRLADRKGTGHLDDEADLFDWWSRRTLGAEEPQSVTPLEALEIGSQRFPLTRDGVAPVVAMVDDHGHLNTVFLADIVAAVVGRGKA